jgi:predicted  nucleic acid-binding Zn-ribbon protein
MSSIEERVAALEDEVVALREQVTDTHTLAAHADRDVAKFRSELRAQARVILTLRKTQVEQGERIDANFAELKGDVAQLKDGMTALRTEMVARFDQVHGGLEQIVRLLDDLGSRE